MVPDVAPTNVAPAAVAAAASRSAAPTRVSPAWITPLLRAPSTSCMSVGPNRALYSSIANKTLWVPSRAASRIAPRIASAVSVTAFGSPPFSNICTASDASDANDEDSRVVFLLVPFGALTYISDIATSFPASINRKSAAACSGVSHFPLFSSFWYDESSVSCLAEGTYTVKYPAARAHATTFASEMDLPHPPRPSRSKDTPGRFNASRICKSHARNSTRRVPLAANSAARLAGAPSGISLFSVSTESSQNRSTSFASNETTSSPLFVAKENVVPSFSRPVAAGRCGSTPPVTPNAVSSEAPSF
mmetsp:Transcript_6125/g.26019  ORF Transcript_6125/g.26019 Transcript_6125/m.26019 type:complete len:304 (+) Transcript_6125:403-1314(+)